MLTVGLDCETTGLNVWRGHRPFSCAFWFDDDTHRYEEWEVDKYTRQVSLSILQRKSIEEITRDPKIRKFFWNKPFDQMMLEAMGVRFEGQLDDAMFMFKCLKSDEFAQLKPFGKKYLDIPVDDETQLREAVLHARREAKKKGWKIADDETNPEGQPWKADYWLCPNENRRYNLQDARRTLLGGLLLNDMLDEEGCRATYDFEMRCSRVVIAMMRRGVHINRGRVISQIKGSKLALKRATTDMYREAGGAFNPNSGPQLRTIFSKLGIQSSAKTETGLESTAFKNIQHVKHPFVRSLIDYNSHKGAVAMFESYMRCMVKEVDGWTIHPSLNQMGPRTGRFSSQWPNLQNVRNEKSVRSDVPIKVRSVFGPRPGYVWLLPDYSQIEVWLFAVAAQEKYMLKALQGGGDIHAENAKKIWPEEYKKGEMDEVVKKQVRTRAKMVGFGIAYGAGPRGIQNVHGCTVQDARQFIDDYLAAFPSIAKYQQRVINRALRDGYVRTMFGRKLQVPRQLAYKGIDYEIQGTGADVMKRAILKVGEYFEKNRIDGYPVLTVHDELMIEVRKDLVCYKLYKDIKDMMESHDGKVPVIKRLPVDFKMTETDWESAKTFIYLEA